MEISALVKINSEPWVGDIRKLIEIIHTYFLPLSARSAGPPCD